MEIDPVKSGHLLVQTSPINTKLGDFVNFGVLFLTMWINSC